MKTIHRALLLWSAAMVLLAFPCLQRKSRRGPPVVSLPDKTQVKSITAKTNNLEESLNIITPFAPEFVVPPEYVSTILGALTPLERYDYPHSWDRQPLGHLKINTKTGNSINITFVHGGQ